MDIYMPTPQYIYDIYIIFYIYIYNLEKLGKITSQNIVGSMYIDRYIYMPTHQYIYNIYIIYIYIYSRLPIYIYILGLENS